MGRLSRRVGTRVGSSQHAQAKPKSIPWIESNDNFARPATSSFVYTIRTGLPVFGGTGMKILIFALFTAGMPLLATVPTQVPEPSSMLLVGGGIAALILIARKKRASK